MGNHIKTCLLGLLIGIALFIGGGLLIGTVIGVGHVVTLVTGSLGAGMVVSVMLLLFVAAALTGVAMHLDEVAGKEDGKEGRL